MGLKSGTGLGTSILENVRFITGGPLKNFIRSSPCFLLFFCPYVSVRDNIGLYLSLFRVVSVA